jgi:hypothetical protein
MTRTCDNCKEHTTDATRTFCTTCGYGMPTPKPVASTDLSTCPFCSGKASGTGTIKYAKTHKAWWTDGTRITEAYFCNCMECGVTNKGLCGHQTHALAVEHWNTRSQANDKQTATTDDSRPSSGTEASDTPETDNALVKEANISVPNDEMRDRRC